MRRLLGSISRLLGTAGRATVALVGIAGITVALANYAVTVGSGTNFGSIVVSTVHYAQQLICDSVTPTQCVSVSAGGAAKVDGSAVTQPVSIATLPSGAVTNAGTFLTQVNAFTSWAGGVLGAMANYGTSPGAVLVPGVNAFVTNTNANGQATAANSSPVVLPAAQVTADPCTLGTKTNFTIATSSGTVQLVAPSGSTQVYICSLFTIGATASIQNIVGGTGATCTTGTPVAVAGSTTAASGMSFAANGGFTFGNGGGTVLRTTTAGHGVCLIQSATAAIAGGGTFVQQ